MYATSEGVSSSNYLIIRSANGISDTGVLDLLSALDALPELSVLYLHGLSVIDRLYKLTLTKANILTDRSLIPLARRVQSFTKLTKLTIHGNDIICSNWVNGLAQVGLCLMKH